MNDWLRFDWERASRTGVGEAVLGTGKSVTQLVAIAQAAAGRRAAVLFTRIEAARAAALEAALAALGPGAAEHGWAYDARAMTLRIGRVAERPTLAGTVAVVAAGSSDEQVAREALSTLEFNGVPDVALVMDVGVAGLWRLLERAEELSRRRIVIAVAGMEGALFSVLAGLVPGLVIAVPTSVGYGVSAGGRAALNAALASCAPGVVVVNVDNGFGAASAALKALGATRTVETQIC